MGVGALCLAFSCLHLSVAAEESKPQEAIKAAAKSLEEQWLDAVEGGEGSKAVELAGKIVGDSPEIVLDAWYVELFARGGVKAGYLSAPFNESDFPRWREALFFKKKAAELVDGRLPLAIGRLMTGLTVQIKPGEDDPSRPPWPRAVWETGRGMCDRMSWTFCELGYQAGFETAVVYLIDAETGSSPHTICEIRSEGEGRWLVDPLKRKLFAGIAAAQAAGSEELRMKLWPEEEHFRKCLENAHIMIPAYPQDYCPRNQKLAAKLATALGDRCPRFGEDPRKRIARFK